MWVRVLRLKDGRTVVSTKGLDPGKSCLNLYVGDILTGEMSESSTQGGTGRLQKLVVPRRVIVGHVKVFRLLLFPRDLEDGNHGRFPRRRQ